MSFASQGSDRLILNFLFFMHGISILKNDTIENAGGVEKKGVGVARWPEVQAMRGRVAHTFETDNPPMDY